MRAHDVDEIMRRLGGCLVYLENQARKVPGNGHEQCLRDMIGAINVAKVRCLALAACTHRPGVQSAGRRKTSEEIEKDRDLLGKENRSLRIELSALWHHSACPFDHCERCIADAPIIKGIRDRLGPPTNNRSGETS